MKGRSVMSAAFSEEMMAWLVAVVEWSFVQWTWPGWLCDVPRAHVR